MLRASQVTVQFVAGSVRDVAHNTFIRSFDAFSRLAFDDGVGRVARGQ